MNEANKIKLGAFLLISCVLLLIGFLSVGALKIFETKFHAMTMLDTSVEGLNVGSPVKYMGLPVGKITRMAMRQGGAGISVYFDIFPSSLDMGDDAIRQQGTVANLLPHKQTLADALNTRNLSCFLNAAGIMGGSYLELSTQGGTPIGRLQTEIKPPVGVIYIPSRPSHIGNAIQNISRMLDELEKVDFIQLADKLNETLNDMSSILHQGELMDTLKMVNSICRNLDVSINRFQKALSEENVKKIDNAINSIDIGMKSLQVMADSDHLGSTVENLNAFLVETRRAIKDAELSGRQLGAGATELKSRMELSLNRIDNLIRQLSLMMERVSDDPNQFVRGKAEKPEAK